MISVKFYLICSKTVDVTETCSVVSFFAGHSVDSVYVENIKLDAAGGSWWQLVSQVVSDAIIVEDLFTSRMLPRGVL